MPEVPILMPQLGESIAEATVVHFVIEEGAEVAADSDVMEVETNKATMSVTAPCAGRLVRWLVKPGNSYQVGAVLGHLEATAEEAERCGISPAPPPADLPHGVTPQQAAALSAASSGSDNRTQTPEARVSPTVRGLPVPAHASGASYLSPRLKARMQELGLHAADLAGIAGSGAAGRVTIEDFERFMAGLDRSRLSPASSMRVAVADAMRRSWTRPLATVGLSTPLEAVLRHRRTVEGKPGPALYALRALALALSENSAVAGRLIGDRIVHPTSIDIGFAVEAEDGVLVPVLRTANTGPFADLVHRYNDLVDLARRRRLPPDATGGSIATVTNFGTFALEWATPIPLPEQTLVLGLGTGRKQPVWDEEKQAFVPATLAGLTLSFDHRVLDGGAAGRLLNRVSKLLEDPAAL